MNPANVTDPQVPATQPEQGSTGNAPATPTPAPKPEETVDYWKQQYNGKNGTAVKLQRQYEETLAAKLELEQKLSEIEVQSQAKIQTYEEQLKAAAKAADEARAEAGKYARAQVVRQKLQSEEFAPLSGFFDDEEILDLGKKNDDELAAFLTKQKAKIEKLARGTKEERNLGSVPTPPPAQNRSSAVTDTKATSATLEEVTARFGFNSPEYKQAFNAHLAAVAASSTVPAPQAPQF